MHWLTPQVAATTRVGQIEPGAKSFLWVSHMSDRGPNTVLEAVQPRHEPAPMREVVLQAAA